MEPHDSLLPQTIFVNVTHSILHICTAPYIVHGKHVKTDIIFKALLYQYCIRFFAQWKDLRHCKACHLSIETRVVCLKRVTVAI